jgi:hypothetical protein
MLSLLDIPRELRDHIIELVLCSNRAPPESPSTASQDRFELHDIRYISWDYGPTHNKYERQDYITSLPLLLVNRQLSAETKSALARLSTKHSYNLDVMFVNEAELWPTWLLVPALSNHVDRVAATFRIFGHWDRKSRSALGIGNASPPQIVWCFYSLMERFLRRGPVGEREAGSQDRNITISVLTLDFLTPQDIDMLPPQQAKYNDWFQSRVRTRRRRADADMANFIMRPEWLAAFVSDFMSGLLRMGYHTARYGMIIYERIGTIQICVDGVLKEEFELSKRLADLYVDTDLDTFGCVWPREERVPFFWRWKSDALRKRREAGLPVI